MDELNVSSPGAVTEKPADAQIVKHTTPMKGLKRRQRHAQQSIADLVSSIPRGTHLTAPEVYRRARDLGLQVSLSTVYRTLHLLQAHGNVSTVSGDRGLRYEAAGSGEDHDHLICVKCGLTIEFFDELIRGFGKSVAQRKGFEHKSSRFDILGLCAECRAKDEDHRIEQAVSQLEESIASLEEVIESLKRAGALYQSRRTAKAGELVQSAARRLAEAVTACEETVALSSTG
ncbi:MAG TPA: transcriptional repressor [Candidatus Obscuribacterales bacterium]